MFKVFSKIDFNHYKNERNFSKNSGENKRS